MKEVCNACRSVTQSPMPYRGHKLCGYCIKDWKVLEGIINREASWDEFLEPDRIFLKKASR